MRQTGRLTADPVLRVLAAVGVLLVPWFLSGPGGERTSWVVQTAVDVLTVVVAVRLLRLPGHGRHTRRFWAAVTAAMACSTLGDTYQTILTVAGRESSQSAAVQSGLVVTGMVIVMITMLFHPFGGAGRQRLRMWLDSATVLVAVAVFLWYFLLAGKLSDGRVADRVGASATTAVMLLVTFGLIKLILSSSAPFHGSAGIVGTLGVTGTAVAAPAAALVTGDSAVMFLAQLAPCLLVPFSLRMQEILIRRDLARRVTHERRRGFSRLPYAAVAATQLLLVAALAAVDPDLRIWGVAVGVLISTGLVLARQQAAFRDNERLVTELSASREWFSALVRHAADLIVVVGTDDVVQYASPAAGRILGAEAGRTAADTLHPRIHPDDRAVFADLNERLTAGSSAEAEFRVAREDGTYAWLHVVATDLRDNPNVRGVVWNSRDITDARRLQDELRHQATHDALTGLANRVLLQQKVRETNPELPICMLLLDLDGFKQVNDVHGHHAGDEVLITVARRVTALLGRAGTIARLGGDEFAVLLPGADPARAAMLADLIAAAVAEPIEVFGGPVTVGASVGVAAGTPADADRLLRDADEAMYRTKQARRAAL